MPTHTRTAPPILDPFEVAAAVGVTADTGADYQFTDAYGVTYSGAPAHLAASALARHDMTARLVLAAPDGRARVRAAALTLLDWFTSPHVDPDHAAEFAALPPMRVCELVTYLARYADPNVLNNVGPRSLNDYTEHLLHDSVPHPDHPLPRRIDLPYRSLDGTEDTPRHPIQVTATAPDGAHEVPVMLNINASEDIYWQFTAPIPIPVDELNELLMDPDFSLGDYLSDNRPLLHSYLNYPDSETEDGISATATLAAPGTSRTYFPAPAIVLELLYVGPTRAAALSTPPFTRRDQADHAAGAGDRIYVASVEVEVGDLRVAP